MLRPRLRLMPIALDALAFQLKFFRFNLSQQRLLQVERGDLVTPGEMVADGLDLHPLSAGAAQRMRRHCDVLLHLDQPVSPLFSTIGDTEFDGQGLPFPNPHLPWPACLLIRKLLKEIVEVNNLFGLLRPMPDDLGCFSLCHFI